VHTQSLLTSTSLFVYFRFYTTCMAIGIEHIKDYTLIRSRFEFKLQPLIQFVIRFEQKFPIHRSLVHTHGT